jgi:hypothetical protein
MKVRLATGIALVILAVVVAAGIFAGLWSFSGTVGPLRLNHALGIGGAAWILVSLPLFRVAHRRIDGAFAGEALGLLVAFVLVSIHFAQQTSRSPAPVPATGLAAYILVALLVLAGLIRWSLPAARPGLCKTVYSGTALSLYVVVGIHALHNFGLL